MSARSPEPRDRAQFDGNVKKLRAFVRLRDPKLKGVWRMRRFALDKHWRRLVAAGATLDQEAPENAGSYVSPDSAEERVSPDQTGTTASGVKVRCLCVGVVFGCWFLGFIDTFV
jgi:hypothetical protein